MIPAETRARAVEMYAAGMTSDVVGAELALTGGRWVRDGLVQRWEPFIAPSKRGMTERERRIEWEEAMFTPDEVRDLHARHANGCREPRTVVGERIYQRNSKRARRAA